MSHEHFIPRSADKTLANQYKNCFYACRFCNSIARKTHPNVAKTGAMLLNPMEVAWAAHFQIVNGQFETIPGDLDGEYTRDAYQLNRALKVRARQIRKDKVSNGLTCIQEGPELVERLNQLADIQIKSSDQILLRTLARQVKKAIKAAFDELSQYLAIPQDAPKSCRCIRSSSYALPSYLDEQTIEVDEL